MIRSMTLPVERSTPNHVPRRDVVVKAGDTFTLNLRIVEADRPDALPLDLAGLGPEVVVRLWGASEWGDYDAMFRTGRVLAEVVGAVIDAADGLVTVTFTLGDTFDWRGRACWDISLSYGGDVTTLCWGTLNVYGRFGGRRKALLLTADDGAVITVNPLIPVVV